MSGEHENELREQALDRNLLRLLDDEACARLDEEMAKAVNAGDSEPLLTPELPPGSDLSSIEWIWAERI